VVRRWWKYGTPDQGGAMKLVPLVKLVFAGGFWFEML